MKPGSPSDSPCTSRIASLSIWNLARARTAPFTAAWKNAGSMRWASSKLQQRARMREAGLKAAQARNAPSCDSIRTVSPASPPPLAMADSKIQGWRRCKERSLPGRKRTDFMVRLSNPCDNGLQLDSGSQGRDGHGQVLARGFARCVVDGGVVDVHGGLRGRPHPPARSRDRPCDP